MSVRDAIFPIVLTVSLISTNYKSAVLASSTPLQLSGNAREVPVITAQNPSPSETPKPSCGDRICP